MTVPTPPQVRPRGAGNEADRFGRVSQLFHWTTVALVIVAFGIGLTLDNWPRGNATREAVITVHKSVGLTILLLTLGRIAWLRRSPAPPPADSLALWERRTAWVVHKLLYAILLLYPLSGFVLSQAAGKPVGFWGLFRSWSPTIRPFPRAKIRGSSARPSSTRWSPMARCWGLSRYIWPASSSMPWWTVIPQCCAGCGDRRPAPATDRQREHCNEP